MTTMYFDAAFYLSQNADVAASPYYSAHPDEHYEQHGRFEGRDPNAYFDETTYRQLNPDVAQSVDAGGFASGYDHWIQYGQREGRSPGIASSFTTDANYFAYNIDVFNAVQAGVFTSGWQHYLQYGNGESRNTGSRYLFHGSSSSDSYVSGNLVGFEMYGGAGNDVLTATYWMSGGRYIFGRDDVLYGEDGNDTITGGPGSDTMTGGLGNDWFVFGRPANAPNGVDADVITDFKPGQDMIRITGLTPTDLTAQDTTAGMTLSYTTADAVGTRATESILLSGVHTYSNAWIAIG